MIETTVPGAISEDMARRLLVRVLASIALSPKRVADLGTAMPCAVYLLDIQRGELLYDNHRVTELLGLDAAAAEERQERDGFTARLHPDDAVKMFAELARWDAVDDSVVIESRFRLLHRDGLYRPFLARTILASRDDEGRAQQVLGCAMQYDAPPNTPRPASVGATAPGEPRPDAAKTVLLVDDRPDILRVAARVLLDAGYLVLTATSGFEALGHGDHTLTCVSALICEVELPDIPGTELAARLEERGLDAPVLYLSSRSPDERFAEAARGTRYTFLRKPFAPAELVRRVELATRG
ncbi:MAG: response regulator [Deltaproteobacteria bacterium]|nr:response regulator [Deltaproteobacteria bacterium]